MERYKIECRHCKRFIGYADSTVVGEFLCSNSSCKATTQVKYIANFETDLRFKFKSAEQPPKDKKVDTV